MMLKVLIVPDSYKGCLSSKEVAQAIEAGIREIPVEIDVRSFVVADGGEGTVEAFTEALNGKYRSYDTLDAYLNPITIQIGELDDKTGIIEVASIVGLHMYHQDQRDPLIATSYGIGKIIKSLVTDGFKKIIIGLGGSCTNDGGMGLLQALGYRFYDSDDNLLPYQALSLTKINYIDDTEVFDLSGIELIVASDVTNPLLGSLGATMIFGPQKGANQDTLNLLEQGMGNYSAVMSKYGYQLDNIACGGAAGGIGAALIGVLKANKEQGIELLLSYLHFDDLLDESTIVISGEGQSDHQSAYGKVIAGIASHTKPKNVPMYIISGQLKPGYEALFELGVKAAYAIRSIAKDDQESFTKAPLLIKEVSKKIIKSHLLDKY